MYTEEYTEQYEYVDDAAGQEGEADDLQGVDLADDTNAEANLQDDEDLDTGAEGGDDDAEEPQAFADYPVGQCAYSCDCAWSSCIQGAS